MLGKLKNFYVNSIYKLSLANVNMLKSLMEHLIEFVGLDRNSNPEANKLKMLSRAIDSTSRSYSEDYTSHPAIMAMQERIKNRTRTLAANGAVGLIKHKSSPTKFQEVNKVVENPTVQQLADELIKKYKNTVIKETPLSNKDNVYSIKDQEVILAFDELNKKKAVTPKKKKKSSKKNIKK